MRRFAPDDSENIFSGRCGVAGGGFLRTSSKRSYLDDPGWHVEVCSERCRKGVIWTVRGSVSRFVPDDFVKVSPGKDSSGRFRKVFYLDDQGEHAEVCSGRFRKGFMWAIRGSMWRLAPDDVVKVLSGRSGSACGGLRRAIS